MVIRTLEGEGGEVTVSSKAGRASPGRGCFGRDLTEAERQATRKCSRGAQQGACELEEHAGGQCPCRGVNVEERSQR